ncbi:MAG: YihA family ribosome biogenesis GTP-binding protein, partial [Pseudomonadota bacterium]
EVMDMLDAAAVTYQIVLTKIDKLKPSEVETVQSAVQAKLKKRPAAHPMILPTSSEKGFGLPELRAEIYGLA